MKLKIGTQSHHNSLEAHSFSITKGSEHCRWWPLRTVAGFSGGFGISWGPSFLPEPVLSGMDLNPSLFDCPTPGPRAPPPGSRPVYLLSLFTAVSWWAELLTPSKTKQWHQNCAIFFSFLLNLLVSNIYKLPFLLTHINLIISLCPHCNVL